MAPSRLLRPAATLLLAVLLAGVALGKSPKKDDDDDEPKRMPAPAHLKVYDFGDMMLEGSLAAPEMGATPGGAQDIAFFRDRVAAGEIPHPRVFTPEGLFSEHDLPLESSERCRQLLCVRGDATSAALLVQPEVRFIGQLGFSSGLDPATWRRQPLTVVAVVDKSGSMCGQPLDMVKASLRELTSQLAPEDQLGIVLYGDRAHSHLEVTAASDEQRLKKAIDSIECAGSTYMEEGLAVGFAMAQKARKKSSGLVRVMLFTDERPNVGRTDAESFMGMAEANSRAGVGMTTIGVGIQFGAELATRISSVRGGNLFFFADKERMEKVFDEELDTMVTELAWDMSMVVRAAPGYKVAGLYGVPGSLVEWTEDGGLKLHVSTIFLSNRKGALYVGLSSDTPAGQPESRPAPGETLGEVELTYERAGGATEHDRLELKWGRPEQAAVGLQRGAVLIDLATGLKEATRRHHEENDQEGAYQIVHALASLLRQTPDPALQPELTLATNLEHTLARLSGHLGEPTGPVTAHPVTGMPLHRAR